MHASRTTRYTPCRWHPTPPFVSFPRTGCSSPLPISSLDPGSLRLKHAVDSRRDFLTALLSRSWNFRSVGNWTTREVEQIIRGLSDVNFLCPFRNLSGKPRISLTKRLLTYSVAHTLSKFHVHTVTLTSRISPQLTSYTTSVRSSYRLSRRRTSSGEPPR